MAATVTWHCTAQGAELTVTVQAPTMARANELALAMLHAFVIERARDLGWAPLSVQIAPV